MPVNRKTLQVAAGPVSGVGVRTGEQISVRLVPAGAGEGLRLLRTDSGRWIRVDLAEAPELPNCTALGRPEDPGGHVLFVEHLLAALHLAGVSDLTAEVDGPELPLLDGSAAPWYELLRAAGLQELPGEVEPMMVRQEVTVGEEGAQIRALPAAEPDFTYELSHPHPLIGEEVAHFSPGDEEALQGLLTARTFATVEELEGLRSRGLLPAGSEENCLVVYADRTSAPPGPNGFARHKLQDLVGDLYLLGRPVIGSIRAHRTGHSHNRRLLRLLAEYDSL